MEKYIKLYNEIVELTTIDGDNKILLCKIIELDKLPNGCYISNNGIGKILGMSRTSASKRISKLKQLGYITTKDVYENNIQQGRICKPTYLWKANGSSQGSKGIVPKVQGGSAQSSKGVVPKVQPNRLLLKDNIEKTTILGEKQNVGISMNQFFKNKI
jgi:hypothetical protein